MKTFIWQLGVSLGVSGAAAVMMGPKLYVFIAIVFGFIGTGLMLGVPGKRDLDRETDGIAGFAWQDLGMSVLLGLFFGATWPSLPIIVLWGAGRRKAELAASHTSGPQDP